MQFFPNVNLITSTRASVYYVRWMNVFVFEFEERLPEEVGHAPNCLMVESINQSGACIFWGVNLEEIVARGMKWISLRVFSALTSLVI